MQMSLRFVFVAFVQEDIFLALVLCSCVTVVVLQTQTDYCLVLKITEMKKYEISVEPMSQN